MEKIALNLMLFLPLAGAVLLILFPEEKKREVRLFTLFIMIVDFALSLFLLVKFQPTAQKDGFLMQFLTDVMWIERFGIHYKTGLDGISLFLVILTTFLGPIVVVASSSGIREKVRGFHSMLLTLQTGMLGAFVSLDLILFYVFWEGMLIPMYFLIGIWGGPRRIYAAVKFFIYTMAGSLLMLVGILFVAFNYQKMTGDITFDLTKLLTVPIPPPLQIWLFLAFAISFAIKVPMFPFHTWLPDAHVEAPTGGSVILAGILLKMGTYGFLRFNLSLFPVASLDAMPWIMGLSIVGIIYGAWVSTVQRDIKKLVAYSSVSHLGLVMAGIFALNIQGVEGAILQMVNHGLSTGALFLLVGMIYERRHTRIIEEFGGIAKVQPVYAALFMIVMLSSVGLPGLNGFIGEILVLLGIFRSQYRVFAFIGVTGLIWGAVYLLRMYQKVMFGPLTNEENKKLKDISLREIAVLVSVIIPIVWIGIQPGSLIKRMDGSVKNLVSHVRAGGMSPSLQGAGGFESGAPGGGGFRLIPGEAMKGVSN